MNTSAIVIVSLLGVLFLIVIIGFFTFSSSGGNDIKQIGNRVALDGKSFGSVYTNDPSQYGQTKNVFVQNSFDWSKISPTYTNYD